MMRRWDMRLSLLFLRMRFLLGLGTMVRGGRIVGTLLVLLCVVRVRLRLMRCVVG